MPSFAVATPEEQAALGAPKTASGAPVDLAPYRQMIGQLVEHPSPNNPRFSVWSKMTLAADDGPRTERHRVSAAAKETGRFVQFSVNKANKTVIYLRLRPPPKSRAKSTNGVVTAGTNVTLLGQPPAPIPTAPVNAAPATAAKK